MIKDRPKPRTKTEILVGWRDIRCGAIIENAQGYFKEGDPQKPDYANDVMRGDMSDAEFMAKLREWKAIPCPARLIIVAVKKYKTAVRYQRMKRGIMQSVPAKPAKLEQRRTVMAVVSEDHHVEIQAAAAACGLSLSRWAGDRLLLIARQEKLDRKGAKEAAQ